MEGNRIIYRVEDNGYGIKPHILGKILEQDSKAASGSGVGLKNVNERIKLCYGQEYGITIESELDVGTAVIITIPSDDAAEGGNYEIIS